MKFVALFSLLVALSACDGAQLAPTSYHYVEVNSTVLDVTGTAPTVLGAVANTPIACPPGVQATATPYASARGSRESFVGAVAACDLH